MRRAQARLLAALRVVRALLVAALMYVFVFGPLVLIGTLWHHSPDTRFESGARGDLRLPRRQARHGRRPRALAEGGRLMAYRKWEPIIALAEQIVRSYSTAVTLRQLFYRLLNYPETGFVNNDVCYKRLSALTAEGRRDGTFPPLVDLTRSIMVPYAFTSPVAAIRETAEGYRRDRTEGQRVTPVLLVEKATLVPQLDDWFGADLGIPIMALRGFQSASYERDVRHWLQRHARDNYHAIYVGDLDASGVDIERNAQRYLGDLFASWERVTVTPEHLELYGLTVNDGKGSDSRAKRFVAEYGSLFQVEVEAFDPDDLHDLLQAAIDAIWDTSAFARATEREDEERRQLHDLADEWRAEL
jgi:hypothetical protein